MPPLVDEVDRRLLEVLRHDGRVSINELARRTNVSRATAYARVARLVADQVIVGFSAEVDARALGYEISALILVGIEQHLWSEARRKFRSIPGVEYIALTSGDFDVLLVVRAADLATLRDVVLVELQSMKEVRQTRTVFILDEERRPLPVEHEP